MDTLEIDRVLAKVPGFLGAHAFNELPTKPNGNYSIVVNTNAEKGEHWLAIVRKNGKNYFLDSFGRSLDDEMFSEEFRKTMRSYVGGSRDDIQLEMVAKPGLKYMWRILCLFHFKDTKKTFEIRFEDIWR